jgi:hypothetical protein
MRIGRSDPDEARETIGHRPLLSREGDSDGLGAPARRDLTSAEVVPMQRVKAGEPRCASAGRPERACHGYVRRRPDTRKAAASKLARFAPRDCSDSSIAIVRAVGPALPRLPHCDSDDARAPSDRELARADGSGEALGITGSDGLVVESGHAAVPSWRRRWVETLDWAREHRTTSGPASGRSVSRRGRSRRALCWGGGARGRAVVRGRRRLHLGG